jgi:hypothetical protein
MAGRRRTTRTSSFGSPGRVSHDSSSFYQGRLYRGQRPAPPGELQEQPLPPDQLDRLYGKTSEDMQELPDACAPHGHFTPTTRQDYDATSPWRISRPAAAGVH